jgi:glycolate oxidase
VRTAATEAERLRFWQGRKAAFPAVGRISPDYYCMDGTIPRRALPRSCAACAELSEEYGLPVANVFHAGDGNMHPLILYDANNPGELDAPRSFGGRILELCVEVGGTITGEHGVGVEKRDLMTDMFNEEDLKQQQRVKCAFDETGICSIRARCSRRCTAAPNSADARSQGQAALPRHSAVLRTSRWTRP